jgi:hypothetical protein
MFLGFSEVSAATPSEKSSAHSSGNHSMDSAVDADPDIQIIESSSSPRKPRKRPLDASENFPEMTASNKSWKDHSKNLLFKVTFLSKHRV